MRGAPEGNQFAKGNKGGRRPSAYEERQNADDAAHIWFDEEEKQRLLEKYRSGKISGRDIFHLMVLEKNEKMVKTLADKMLPDKLDEEALKGGFGAMEALFRSFVKKDGNCE